MKKITPIALASLLSIAALTPTLAQAELSFNLGAKSSIGADDHRYGADGTNSPKDFKPAMTFGVDYPFASGFYLSNSNVSGKFADNNNLEMTLTAGYANELANGFSYDVSASRYVYPQAGLLNGNDATISVGFAGFSLAYTKPFTSSKFEGAHTTGLGYSLGISDQLNVDFLVEKEQGVSGTLSTITVNYDFGNAFTGYAEFTEDHPKTVIGFSKAF